MKALIAAGGHGTRLRPITYSMNKHLIPIANRAMIFYAIEKVVEAGITEIAININEGDDSLSNAVGDGSRWNAHITFLEQQGGALGLAHIIKNAAPWLEHESFVFYLGDNIILGALKPFVEHFVESKANAYLALSRVSDPARFGVPELNNKGEIVRILEKPKNPPSDFAVTGIYCYDSTILDAVNAIAPSARGELEISDAHTYLIEHGKSVKYEIVDGWWKDTGKPEDLLEGNRLLLDLLPKKNHATVIESSVTIDGNIDIASNVELRGSTKIIGPVSIGQGTIICDSVIGPNVAIGQHAQIRQSAIRNAIIMDGASIETPIPLVDSIVGHNVRIHTNSHAQEHRCMIGENSFIEF